MPRLKFPLTVLFVFSLQIIVQAQIVAIGGKVTLDGKPAANILVVVFPDLRGGYSPDMKPAMRGKTDVDGRFEFANLAPGKYSVLPQAPAHVLERNSDSWLDRLGKAVVLEAGESRKNLEFNLRRGAVVTGRITDADGKPVIGERVRLRRLSEDDKTVEDVRSSNWLQGETDDRGVYRYYGLRAGRYRVSIGLSVGKPGEDIGAVMFSGDNRFYPITFHPATNVEEEAKIVEVRAGETTENVDVRVGKKVSACKISGRAVSAETGAAIEKLKAELNIEVRSGEDNRSSHIYGGVGQVKENGEFQTGALPPGKYYLNLYFMQESSFYSTPAIVEITDADVTNAEIKLSKGATLSGRAEIGNQSGATTGINLSQISLGAFVQTEEKSGVRSHANARVQEDGSFRITGLAPGTARISFNNRTVKGLSLARIERGGVPQTGGIKIASGESVDDLRIVLLYGNNILRGEIKLENGEPLPEKARINISARPTEPGRSDSAWGAADERGRFLLENLLEGEYEISVNAEFPVSSQPNNRTRPAAVKKLVTISPGADNRVELTLKTEGGN